MISESVVRDRPTRSGDLATAQRAVLAQGAQDPLLMGAPDECMHSG